MRKLYLFFGLCVFIVYWVFFSGAPENSKELVSTAAMQGNAKQKIDLMFNDDSRIFHKWEREIVLNIQGNDRDGDDVEQLILSIIKVADLKHSKTSKGGNFIVTTFSEDTFVKAAKTLFNIKPKVDFRGKERGIPKLKCTARVLTEKNNKGMLLILIIKNLRFSKDETTRCMNYYILHAFGVYIKYEKINITDTLIEGDHLNDDGKKIIRALYDSKIKTGISFKELREIIVLQ